MKSLYFVGNEELWNDAWFLALVESLKKHSLSVILLDPTKDAPEIKKAVAEISAYERMVFHKGADPDQIFQQLGIKISDDKKSLLYVFSEIVNPNAEPKQLPWHAAEDEILKTIGLWGASQIIEEAFLFDHNLADQVSKAIGQNDDSLMDTNLLTANADEISQLIDIAPAKVEKKKEDQATVLEKELFDVDAVLAEAAAPEKIQPDVQKTTISASDEEKVIHSAISEEAPIPVSPTGAGAFVEVSHLISSISNSVTGEDLDVIKRYASIKERELRESQAATEALRRQIRYFDERLKKSEEERRRLLIKMEETENELRTVADKKDENKAQLKSVESHYDEKIKELQIQLESSQFQAGKLEKKLIDFRERVRNDLQKIRSRERELASRLEIQKRDAEALLSAKDERLLGQKRDVDRLEFELDALKERLLDDAQKTEERRRRVARALQSLKLAQSILSGLEEDSSLKDEKDKAA